MSYLDRLGMCGLPRHDHLIVKDIKIKFDRVYIEFEPDNIISNCRYGFDMEYGGQYEPISIMGNSVHFVAVGNLHEYMEELEKVKAGDKMYFHSNFPIGGKYHNGRPFKYVEL